MNIKNITLSLFAASFLTACSWNQISGPSEPTVVTKPIVENACVGEIVRNIPGLVAIEDPALHDQAVAPDGNGGLCVGQVYQVQESVTVFRVWDKNKPYTKYGRWWSLNKPTGSKEEYREANDICPSWSELNQVSQCKLKVGSKIVIGPGQSATCKTKTLDKSPVNQVFVPNDSRNNVLMVEECSAGEDWPYLRAANEANTGQ